MFRPHMQVAFLRNAGWAELAKPNVPAWNVGLRFAQSNLRRYDALIDETRWQPVSTTPRPAHPCQIPVHGIAHTGVYLPRGELTTRHGDDARSLLLARRKPAPHAENGESPEETRDQSAHDE